MSADTVPALGPKFISLGPLPLINLNLITLLNAASLDTEKLTVCVCDGTGVRSV